MAEKPPRAGQSLARPRVIGTRVTGAPSISVVVPALNEERHVGHLLSDIACQSRRPQEVVLVDAGSHDNTVAVARGFSGVRILHGERPVANGRNLGGCSASGKAIIFLDADARLPETFLKRFVEDFSRRRLDVSCPLYAPHDSTKAVERFHGVFNLITQAFQGTLPSGAGICVAVRSDLFRESRGFDPGLKFDDIELIRRLSGTALRHRKREGLRLRPALQGARRYARHPRVLAYRPVLRPRPARVGEPHELHEFGNHG